MVAVHETPVTNVHMVIGNLFTICLHFVWFCTFTITAILTLPTCRSLDLLITGLSATDAVGIS